MIPANLLESQAAALAVVAAKKVNMNNPL